MYDRRLVDYLPPVLRDVREFKALMDAEDPEIAALWDASQAALNDQFVATATVNGVKRWEAILGITPKATFTLDERKFTILTKLSEQLPYTYRMLESMLSQLCGADGFKLRLVSDEYTLYVQVALTAVNNFNDVQTMLARVVPANMVIDLSIEFNQWFKLQSLTWGDVVSKTWYQLRNEVL